MRLLVAAWLVCMLLALGCDEPAVVAAPPRWRCPAAWIHYARGGCGPSSVLCAPDGGAAPGACAGDDGGASGAWRAPGTEGGPPPRGWIPDGVPDATWSPEAGVSACATGWTARDDHTCDPRVPEACDTGALPLPAARCTAGEAACAEGDYPDPGAEAVGAARVYVRERADATLADGSAARPFPTLSAALSHAASGAWVLVASGAYDASITVRSDVHLVGVCAARVTLRGVGTSDATDPPALAVTGASASLDLRGVTVSGGVGGVVASSGARASLRGVRVERAAWVGVAARGGGTALTVDDVAVTEARARSDGQWGDGVLVSDGARLDARGLAVVACRGYGVDVYNATADLTDLYVRDTRFGDDAGASYGAGVVVRGAARAAVRRAVILRNASAGFSAAGSGAVATLDDALVAESAARVVGAVSSSGQGIVAVQGARITAQRVEVRGNRSSGVFAGDRASITLSDAVVRGTRLVSNESGLRSIGAACALGATVTLARTRVGDMEGIGLAVDGAGSHLSGEDVVIEGIRPLPVEAICAAAYAYNGGAIDLARVRVSSIAHIGLGCDGAGARFSVRDAVVRGVYPLAYAPLSAAALVSRHGATFAASNLRIADNFGSGAGADNGADLALDRAVIERTTHRSELPLEAQSVTGQGLAVVDGARLTVTRALVSESSRFGVTVSGVDARLDLSDSVIRATGASESEPSTRTTYGLGVEHGAAVGARRVLFEGNRVSVAVIVTHEGTRAAFEDLSVSDTRGADMDASGQGLQVNGGATVTLSRGTVEGAHTAGVAVYQSGTRADLTDVAIAGTRSGRFGDERGAGVGLVAGMGATVYARRARIDDSTQVGAWSVDEGTSLDLEDVVVRGVGAVVNGASRVFGDGVVAQAGGRVDARRIAVLDARGLALGAVLGDVVGGAPRGGSVVRASDVFLRGVEAESIRLSDPPSRPVAYGVHVARGCSLDVSRAVIDGAQWGFFQSSGALTLRESVVAGQSRGAGASNGASAAHPLTLDRVTFTDVAGPVARDIELPEALLPPPPLP